MFNNTRFQRKLTMNRSGEFKIFTHGDSHCGTMTDQFLPIKYHLICVCEDVLDARGFLFDQISVEEYFQSLKRTKMSCEKLTISCARRLASIIRRDNPKVKIRSIDLTLSPFPHAASMTYTVHPRTD